MDHRISKDMISSGMTPSGEKAQEDLSRTQYGSTPSPSSLMEAYKTMYEHHQKDADGKVIEHEEKEELNEGKMPEGLKNYLMKKGKKKDDKKEMKEDNLLERGMTMTTRKIGMQNRAKPDMSSKPSKPSKPDIQADKPVSQMNGVDLFDIVKGKLIDEGVDEKEAIKIMVSLSEEELNELLGGRPGDGYFGHPNLGIKNPFAKKQIKKQVMPGSSGGGLINKTAGQLGDRKMMLQKMMNDM